MWKGENGFKGEGGCKGGKGWDGKGGKGVKGKGDDRQMQVASGWENVQGTTQTVYTWTSTQPWPDHSNSWATHASHDYGSSWEHPSLGYGSSWERGTRWQEHRPGHQKPWETAYEYEQEFYPGTRSSMIWKWHDTFCRDFDIDDEAWRALLLLAQRCAAGYRKANGIIHKMYEREQKGGELYNPSAFVRKCVREAEKDIDPRSHWNNRF